MKCYYAADPMVELSHATKATVKQRFEPWEVISGCETPNQYYVFVKDQNNNEKYLFKAKEESNCCCRNFCSGSARSFVLHLRTISAFDKGKSQKQDYADFHRPYKCSCCCLNRPVMIGKVKNDVLPGDIGKIVQKFSPCDPKVQIYNREGKAAWMITADCCQLGYCCAGTPCGRCSEVDFEIFSGDKRAGRAPDGTIHKSFRGLQSVIGDADFFDIKFPEKATPEGKFMLITSVIMLDYMYYEDKDDSVPPGHHIPHYG